MPTDELCPICGATSRLCECTYTVFNGEVESRRHLTPTDILQVKAVDLLALLQTTANNQQCAVHVVFNRHLEGRGLIELVSEGSTSDFVEAIMNDPDLQGG